MNTILRTILGGIAFAGAAIAYAQTLPPDLPSVPKQYPWDQRPRKCFMPGDAAKFDPQCRLSNWPDYATSKGRVDRLFIEPDFDLVERAEKELGFSKEKFASGEYYFDAWYLSLQVMFRHQAQLGGKNVKEWAARKGADGYVKLAEALVHYGEAWEARGRGFANTVAPEAWKLYYTKLVQANQALDSASASLKQTGPWHALKLEIAFQNPDQEKERLALLEAAIVAWPDYTKIYQVPMRFAHPRWGGSFELMDGIARFSMEKTKAQRGAAYYALLYELAVRGESRFTLQDTKVDWSLMKQGFRDLETGGAAPQYIWRNFARLACQMRDREEAQRLYVLFDKHKNPSQASEPTDSCRVFAMSKE
jgi:hypothetical protein